MLKIFLAEDHEPFRLALKANLERIDDFTVIGEARDGMEAVELVCRLKPDVVLMDIEMPFIDGIEATQRIKRRSQQVAVVMLTAHQHDNEIFAAFAAGADGYCLKNADINRIVLAVRTVADGAVWLDPGIAKRVLRVTVSVPAIHATPAGGALDRITSNLRFSARERSVLRLVAEGLTNPQIARELSVKPETVKTHLGRIMDKLAVDDRTQAAVKALRQGII
ncbi:MAG TPA: response regulator transcription factor [Candidatus Obscuribacterales bacterium]